MWLGNSYNYIYAGSLTPAGGGGYGAGNAYKFYGPAFSPTYASYIDKKIDDGLPTAGRILADGKGSVAPNYRCISGGAYQYQGSNPNATYVSSDEVRCVIYFTMDN